MLLSYFFFNDTATTEIYTLSLHDALPIYVETQLATIGGACSSGIGRAMNSRRHALPIQDRKSTRLNSSHRCISYAVFCLKKKKKKIIKHNKSINRYNMTH